MAAGRHETGYQGQRSKVVKRRPVNERQATAVPTSCNSMRSPAGPTRYTPAKRQEPTGGGYGEMTVTMQ